jgi:multiple sugar transport system ATP-binding protein
LRVHTRGELKRLQSELGVTTIYVTHDQAEAMTLADRIAIMRDGLLQQVGSPRDIYERPANTFVGGFLGSPGMNFLLGRLEADDGQLAWTFNGQRLPLSPDWTARLGAGPSYEGVYLGVRPEDVRILAQPQTASSLPAEVYVAEALGNETLVRLQIAGQEMVVRADASYEPEMGARVWVEPDLRRAHLSDASNQQRIT